MRLYLIRHAAAFDRDRRRWPDDRRRPLTPEGARRFRKAAAGLKRLVGEVDCVLASPLTRARQTAEILATVAGWPRAIEIPELAPGAAAERVLAAIRERAAAKRSLERLAIVGHEPGLTELLAACAGAGGARARVRCQLKKGGAACLRFRDSRAGPARLARPGQARLEWLITPRALRALGGGRPAR